ncbi:MAE_28990/MAE_18760 family HEPN-like nuclease [Erythrobacter sp. W302b]|uniref:MAE_28990/MAE_18760 family HEPN-like nuclease n=1 Tax=Erythrobacter sp. W302b TaxID=3389874 RepID=UPI00396AFCE7
MTYSRAFQKFEDRLEEVKHLKVLGNSRVRVIRKKLVDSSFHTNALIRAATVLLSSHIQGYVEDLAELLLERAIACGKNGDIMPDTFRYQYLKGEIKALRQSDDPDKLVRAARRLNAKSDILDITKPLPSIEEDASYKDGFGNPTSTEIKKFLSRFGVKDLDISLKIYLKTQTYIAGNAVDQIIDRRTKIAHGDPSATLTPKDFLDYLNLVRKYCAAIDRSACKHFKNIGCTGFY